MNDVNLMGSARPGWQKKVALIGIVGLTLVPTAAARSHAQVTQIRVCQQPIIARTRALPRGSQITAARPFVDGHELATLGIGQVVGPSDYQAVEGSGFGVIVRLISHPRRTEIRLASVRSDCASFKLVLGWRN
jgi:hypothetical protein